MGMLVAGALFAAGASLTVVNFFAIGFGATLVNAALAIGISVGSNAIIRALTGANAAVASIRPADGQQQIHQAVPPRWKSAGIVRLAGPVWWFQSDKATKSLYLGLTLNHGRIGGFLDYRIDDRAVDVDDSGAVVTSPYTGVTTKILTRLGVARETKYGEILSTFGYDEMRGDGVATMLGIFQTFADASAQLENYPNGKPALRATIKASVWWDPRDPAQSRTDQTTWQWSENPIVVLLGFLLDPDGYAMPWARIEKNLAQWTAAMDVCDEPVLSIDEAGFVARYRLAGTWQLTDKPKDVVSRILSTCDGRMWQKRNGSMGIAAGRFQIPTVTISDRDITGVELVAGQDPVTAIAGVRARYMSPVHDYQEQDAEPWPKGDDVLALGEDRVAQLDLVMIPAHAQTRRLMKRIAVRAAAEWRGTIRTNLAGLRARDETTIRLVISELGIDGSFELGKMTLDRSKNECQIEVASLSAEIDEWDPATEEGTAPAVQGLTVLLLHFDGSDGSTTFTDSSTGSGRPHAIVAAGDAQIDTDQSVFGSSSGLFDGSGDFLRLDGSDDFNFADGDFTIDCWVRLASIGAIHNLFDGRQSGKSGAYVDFGINEAGNPFLFVNSTYVIVGNAALASGQWYHLALVRGGQSAKIYLNGQQTGPTWTDTTKYLAPASNRPLIGANAQSGTATLNGWLDELRVSKGVARWTSNFTPPSLPYS